VALLVEKLLLAKDSRISKREKDVLAGLETLREPVGVVNRRKAKQIALNAAGVATARQGLAGGPTQIATDQGIRVDPEAAEKLARHEVSWHHRASGGSVMSIPTSADMVLAVPPELRPYLTYEKDQEVLADTMTWLRAVMSTGGLYRVDGGELGAQGVLDSVWGGLPFTELPPLPFARMWFEARGPNGDHVPLWQGSPPDGSWNANDTSELWGMAITEIVPGASWGVCAVRKDDWEYVSEGSGGSDTPNDYYYNTSGHRYKDGQRLCSLRYERLELYELTVVPDTQDALFMPLDADQPTVAHSEQAYRAAMLAWAVCLVDMVTARNVDRRQAFLPRKAMKQLGRVAPRQRFEPRIYEVSIATATGDAKDETGNYLSCRFVVRGHWRKSWAEHAKWIDSKEAYCVWVTGHVKGPPGAPWKGRAVYVEPGA
jgi:hypothetical protein